MIRDLGADEVVRDGKGLASAGGNSTKSMVDSIQGLRPDGRLVTMGADHGTHHEADAHSRRPTKRPEHLYEALDTSRKEKSKRIVET